MSISVSRTSRTIVCPVCRQPMAQADTSAYICPSCGNNVSASEAQAVMNQTQTASNSKPHRKLRFRLVTPRPLDPNLSRPLGDPTPANAKEAAWLEQTERLRQRSLGRTLGFLLLFAGLFVGGLTANNGQSTLAALALVGVYIVGGFAIVFGLAGFIIRPRLRATPSGPALAYLALMPNNVLRQLGLPGSSITYSTVAGRLVIGSEALRWYPSGYGKELTPPLTFAFKDIQRLSIDKMANVTPLGYLHIEFKHSQPVVDMRIFQPKAIERRINSINLN